MYSSLCILDIHQGKEDISFVKSRRKNQRYNLRVCWYHHLSWGDIEFLEECILKYICRFRNRTQS